MPAFLAVMLLALAPLAAAAEWKVDCPAQLATTQSTGGPPPGGWSIVARTSSAVLDATPGMPVSAATPPVSISVFDGPPAQMADLVPDNPNAKVQRWTFGKARTRDIYIVCNYADTRIKLARKAPAEVASCTLGSPAGTSIVCK
jgi:hypothetical protein